MERNTVGSLAGALAILVSSQAFGQGKEAVIACRAELSAMGSGIVAIQIVKGSQGALQAQINGKVSNPNVRAEEYPIREKLNFKTDPYSEEFRGFNAGETSLVHLQTVTEDKELGPLRLKLPYDLKQVRKMTIYDLQGRQDKFGGTVLMEAYNASGKLLGRVFRSVFATRCT